MTFDQLSATDQARLYQALEQMEARFQNASTTINRRTGRPWDEIGIQRFTKMLENLNKTGTITPGEFEYLFDRTHPRGRLPNYNRHCGLDRKLGSLPECPVDIFVKITDWSAGMATNFRRRLTQELGVDIPRCRTAAPPVISSTYNDLFTEANS